MKKLSVIVPVFNVEKYIRECIDSIINQTYTNLEIILIDDGSEDNSGKICDEYAQIDSRVIVIHQNNAGQSAARNAGMRIAMGEYIGFADSDDWLHNDMYHKMMLSAIKNEADIVECHSANFIDGGKAEYTRNNEGNILSSGKEALERLVYPRKIAERPSYAVWSKVYKRELIEDELFPEGYIHEEYFYDAKVFLKAKRYLVLKDTLYFHRIRENSTTTSKFSEKDLDKLKLIKQRIAFLTDKGDEALAKYSEMEYFRIELLYYARACEVNNVAVADLLKEELKKNKNKILSWDMAFMRRLDMSIFFFSGRLYCAWYRHKKFIKMKIDKKQPIKVCESGKNNKLPIKRWFK